MKTKFILTTILLCIIMFRAEEINATGKGRMGYPIIFGTTGYMQDTPKFDSAKHHNKPSKKIKLNKDSIRRFKKDTV